MSFEIVQFNLFGLRPLMQNAIDLDTMEAEAAAAAATTKRQSKPPPKSPLEEARSKLHVTEDGLYFHPGLAFWGAMTLACVGVKIKGVAATSVLPPGVEPAEEEVILVDPATLNSKTPKPLGKNDWFVDRRAIQTSKGMIIVRRPKFKVWGARLTLEVDRDTIPGPDSRTEPTDKHPDGQPIADATGVLTQILNMAGRMGVGSGRLHREIKGTSSIWKGILMGKFRAELWK